MSKSSRISTQLLISTYLIVFVCWGFYRYFTHNSDLVDEIIAKPLIWISPVIFISLWKKIKLSELGFRKVSQQIILLSVIVGIGLTALQFLPLYFQFHKSPFLPENFTILVLATIGTAFSEEVLLRGFIFKQLSKTYSLVTNTIITSILFALIHLPILVFVQNITGISLLSSLYIIFVSSVFFCLLYWYRKNLWSPIIAHFIFDALLLIF